MCGDACWYAHVMASYFDFPVNRLVEEGGGFFLKSLWFSRRKGFGYSSPYLLVLFASSIHNQVSLPCKIFLPCKVER